MNNQVWTTNYTDRRKINNRTWTMNVQITHNIPIFSFTSIAELYPCKFLYILERLSLEAPCEYVHSGPVLRLDWAPCQLSYLFVLAHPAACWSSQRLIFHMFTLPYHLDGLTLLSKKTIWLCDIPCTMACIDHIIVTIHPLPYTSSTLLGRPAGPDHSCQEH
jgi:hypothetical protein